MTKLYFHNATTEVTGTLPSTVQSALGSTPSFTADAASVNRSMNSTIGTSQASLAISATAATNKLYFTRFVSDPLTTTSISANTWNFALAAKEVSLSGNFPVSGTTTGNVTVYVWRPSTGAKVSNIIDSTTGASFTEPSVANTEKSIFTTFSGSAVTAQAGDVICIEIYWSCAATAATTDTFYYDGTTETNASGTTVSNHASYIETPQSLSFQSQVKLYFHGDLNGETTLPSSEQSTLTADVSVDGATINRLMTTTIGAAQQSLAITTNATASQQNIYVTRFVSDKLNGVSSIAADTWFYSFAAAEDNTSANFPASASNSPVYVNCYVWRPSAGGSVVGTILDGNTASVFAEASAANTEKAMYGSFSGSLVSGISNGDVIVLEVWFRITQANATSRGDTFYFDGTTENKTINTTVSNHASYIATWQQLSFTAAAVSRLRTIQDSVTVSESASTLMTPTPGHNADVKTKKMTLTADATSGVHDQSFTGVGFSPKAVIVWGVLTSANDAYQEAMSASYGFSDGTNNVCVAAANVDNVSTLDNSNILRNDACISLLSTATGNAELVRGKVKTLDSDGITVTWNVKNTTQYIIHALFIGGSDITNVIAKQETAGRSTTGNQGYTGYGFKPDVLLFAQTANVTVNTLTAGIQIGFGAATSSTAQFASSIYQQDAVLANTGGSAGQTTFNSAALAAIQGGVAGNSTLRAALTSLDSDGYTLNHTLAPQSSTYPFIVLAIKGGFWNVGLFQQRTSTGTTTVSQQIVADPEALMLVGTDANNINTNNTASGAIDASFSIGAADNTTEGYAFFGDTLIVTPNRPVMYSSTAKIIRNATPAATATSSTLTAEADTSDMTTLGQFSINYTTADSVQRYIGYIVLMKGPASSGTTFTRTPSDTTSVSESISRVATKIRSKTDTTSLSESLSRVVTHIRSKTDTTTLSESLSRVKTAIRSKTDSTTLSESISRVATKIRSKTDTTSVSETISRVKTALRTKTDTTSVSDSLSRFYTALRTKTDSVSITESLQRLLQLKRVLSDTVNSSESLSRSRILVPRIISDTISSSESLSRIFTAIRTVSDTVSLSEILSRLALLKRILSDTTSTSDSVDSHRIYTRSRTDTTTLSESISTLLTRIRSMSDTVTTSETLARHATLARILSDTISLSESLVAHLIRVRSLSDTVNSSESLSRILSAVRSLTDSVSLSESLDRHTTIKRLVSDTINLSESISAALTTTIHRSISDTITLSESLVRKLSKSRAISDTITLSESLIRSVIRVRSRTDTTTLSESLTRAQLAIRSLTDTISKSESLSRVVTAVRARTDSTSVSELLQKGLLLKRLLSETVTLSESLIGNYISGNIQRFISDTVVVSELLSRIKTAIRGLEDDISGGGFTKFVYHLSDTVAVSDSIFVNVIRQAAQVARSTFADWSRQGREAESVLFPPKPLPQTQRVKTVRRFVFDSVPVQESIETKVSKERIKTVVVTKALQAASTKPQLELAHSIRQHNQKKTRRLQKLYKLASVINLIKELTNEGEINIS